LSTRNAPFRRIIAIKQLDFESMTADLTPGFGNDHWNHSLFLEFTRDCRA
jgi:hypothetical protein